MSEATYSTFARALTDRQMPVPEGLASWNGPRPVRRFGVYRNNVGTGLVEALRSRFPVTEKIVGETFFGAMAEAYIGVEPPRSPLLLAYGDTLANFIDGFAPAADLPYLPDIIRLEAARSHAYHAADHAPLHPEALSHVDPANLSDLTFEPHPSLSVIRSAHPVATIWAMNSGEMPLAPIEPWQAEDALVIRPAMIVHVHRLPPGGAVFIMALQYGRTLGDAIAAATESEPDFDLTANLAGLLQTGSLTAIN